MKKAILYMILAALFFTVLNASIRFVDHLPTMQIVFFRALGTVIFCLTIIAKNNIPILGKNRKLLLLRGIVGVAAMAVFFRVMQILPIASAVSLRYLSPFFAAVLAVLFLKEKMRRVQWLFFLFAFIGVILLKGFDTRISFDGLILGLISAALVGIVYVIIRKIGKSEHPLVIINYFMTLALILGGVCSIFSWIPPVGIEWLVLCFMGVFGFFAQLFMTMALQSEETHLIIPFKYAEVVFTLVVGWMFFGEYQTWVTIGGISLIVFSLIANVYFRKKG
jgi:drug/metabolite transporter (DMT)-like permease